MISPSLGDSIQGESDLAFRSRPEMVLAAGGLLIGSWLEEYPATRCLPAHQGGQGLLMRR